MQKATIFFVPALVLTLSACNSKPKVIEAESEEPQSEAPIFQETPMGQETDGAPAATAQQEHQVVVKEVMNTERYSYLRVTENGSEFWIAIGKRDVKVGNTYYYRGGLMKKNFQSQEFNRVFETIYLVSDFRDANGESAAVTTTPAAAATVEPPAKVTPAAGAIKIADLVGNLAKYDGKVVKVTGKVVKLNAMIMGRNWVHLQDGSGKNLDLTVTTSETVALGSVVTLEGTLGLNRDFGAGYRYDYIVEGAVVK